MEYAEMVAYSLINERKNATCTALAWKEEIGFDPGIEPKEIKVVHASTS